MRLIINGPFTTDEIQEIAATMRRIEARRPDETFSLIVDADETITEQEFQRILGEQPPGYERIIKQWKRK